MILIQEHSCDDISHLLLPVLGRRYQANCLHMSEIDIIAQHVDVQHLPHVLLTVIGCIAHVNRHSSDANECVR